MSSSTVTSTGFRRQWRTTFFAVVAEAVHNAAARSQGNPLDVEVTIDTDHVEVSLADGGIGPPHATTHGLGLGSMASSARELLGTFSCTAGLSGGTSARWRVPMVEPGS